MSDQARYRNALPQLRGGWFLTDGGLETTLVFHEGIELPYFAACTLLDNDAGLQWLRRYFSAYIEQARSQGAGFLLESVTWRAHADYAEKLGWSKQQLAEINRLAISLLVDLRAEHESDALPMPISGCVGPRGDGYVADERMSAEQAQAYHSEQVNTLAGTAADLISAMTLNYIDEAIGITRAGQAAGIPVAISFTLETDGRLPSGETLQQAIEAVDAATDTGPAYYMINCAHPSHFAETFDGEDGSWRKRIQGLRANASCKSHEELDNSDELDEGNPAELGSQYRDMLGVLDQLNVMGGCCGTDHRHVAAIGEACAGHFQRQDRFNLS